MIVSCFYFIQQILCLFFFAHFCCSRCFVCILLICCSHIFILLQYFSHHESSSLSWTEQLFPCEFQTKWTQFMHIPLLELTIPFASRFNELVWHILALCTCRDDAANVFTLKGFNGYFDICKYRCMLQMPCHAIPLLSTQTNGH